MNYRAKRNAKGLSAYTVSSRLGIDYNLYLEIEKRKRNLEGNRINKFQEILNNNVQIKLEYAQKMKVVEEWYESGQAKRALKDFGYTTSSLAKILKVSQPHISNTLNGRGKGLDLKERIYDFLHDNLNKKIDDNVKPQKESLEINKEEKVKSSTNNESQTDLNYETLKVVCEHYEKENEELRRYLRTLEKLIEMIERRN